MSHWTNLNGQIISKKLSVKKIIKSVLDGEDWIGEFENDNKFSIRFEQDSEKSCQTIKKIIEYVKSRDGDCRISLESHIPWES